MSPRPKCPRCEHAEHRKGCTGRDPSKCQTYASGGATGFICGSRPPCSCPFRVCKCGAPVALAAELPADARGLPAGEVMVVSVERGSARDPAGRLAVRILDLGSGHLACRDLADGEQPREGEWRATEHTNAGCPKLAACEADARWIDLRGAA
jgi:hypothetical protein